jgi:hypothetical protein
VNPRFLAICLWLLAWALIDITAIAALGSLGGRWRLTAAIVAGGGFATAVLVNAGADLW